MKLYTYLKNAATILFISFLCFSILTVVQAKESDELTILFTHDLHDNFYPFEVEREGELVEVGGYARLATLIEAERKLDPEAILVDAGDYAMGTLFQTIFSTHAPTLHFMGHVGYDAVTFGNHEFDFRAEGLADSLLAASKSEDPTPSIVATNLITPGDEATSEAKQLKDAMDQYGVKPYKIIERNNFKIGLFGLLGNDAISNAPMAGVSFEDPISSAEKMVNILKEEEEVDLIIALSHSGTSDIKKNSEDEHLAEKVPGIDIIISGHSHTMLQEPIIINDTVIGSTGEYGEHLGVMTVSRTDTDRWNLMNYELKQVNHTVEPSETIEQWIEEFKDVVQTEYLNMFDFYFDEVLAYSPFRFTDFSLLYDEHVEQPIGNLIGDAYKYIVKENEGEDYEPITATVIPVGTIRSTFYEGDITVSDVFNVSSLGVGPDEVSGYPLVEVYLTGKELKTIAEVDASVAPMMPSAQLYIAGLSYTFNPKRLLFNKVTDVHIQLEDGTLQQINDDELYRVVAGLYSGQMLPVVSEKSFGLLSIEPKQKDGSLIVDFEDHILHLQDGTNREIKEWYALARYLASFPKVDGTPQIPNTYQDTQNRKNVDERIDPISLVKHPNWIAVTIYVLGAALLLILFFVVRLIIQKVNRRKQ